MNRGPDSAGVIALARKHAHRSLLVHGGFLPGKRWRSQPARVVTRIQVIGPDGEPHKRSDFPDAPH